MSRHPHIARFLRKRIFDNSSAAPAEVAGSPPLLPVPTFQPTTGAPQGAPFDLGRTVKT